MRSLEALVQLLLSLGEERMGRRIGMIWLALGELIRQNAPLGKKADIMVTLREVYEEPPGLMKLRIHPASPELVEEATQINEHLDTLRRRVLELSRIYHWD